MKSLSIIHLQRLDALKNEQFLLACVQKLDALSIKGAFPPKREDYFNFTKHIQKVAHKYGLHDKQTIFALMLAWHLKGDAISQDHHFIKILNDPSLSTMEKREYFEKFSLDIIAQQEEKE
jgi:hypothetical protein